MPIQKPVRLKEVIQIFTGCFIAEGLSQAFLPVI